MEAITIEIINPKAMRLLKSLQDLNLIKVSDDKSSKLKNYLKKMRKNDKSTPSLEEITKIVERVRAGRYAKN